MRCLEENTLFEYVHAGLDDAARTAIADHAATCDACRQLIAAAVRALPSQDEGQDDGAIGPDAPTVAGHPGAEPEPRAPRDPHADAPVPDDRGRVIARKYQVVRLLGAGGMGRVHEAINLRTGRRVAVKELLGAFSGDAIAGSRFMLEAQSASRIAHPNVVDILDLGEDPATGALFMVQELLTGQTLRQRLTERGALSVDEALRVVTPALAALVVAHDAGVIHRDVKPENLFLARDTAGNEVTKLIDFGLSKRVAPGDDLALTEHGRQLGTPYYMSPEQLRGDPDLDGRTDVWSIGVVLFELVSGGRPFFGPSYHDLVVQILKDPIPVLTDALPTVPAAFAALVARALERDRARRIAMRELAAGLTELARRPEARTVPSGNPYRGLAAFDAAYRGVFFGRGDDVAAVIDRVRRAPFVLVAGDSGVGKSSLVRAGVIPALTGDGAITAVTIRTGRAPLHAIGAALAPIVRDPDRALDDAAAIAAQLCDDPAALAARLSRALGDGPAAKLIVFIDQLEELITFGDAGDAALATSGLWLVLDAVPALRVIATVRSDFLARLARLPGLGDELTAALYLLRPLAPAGVREAIVGPARITGLGFESAALVDELVAAAGTGAGGELPLLQFALAALWEARDVERGMICEASLRALGGVAGALARHADGVLAGVSARLQPAARHALTQLVTDDGTRARRSAAELADLAHPVVAIRAVLEALIAGRLITVDRIGDGEPTYQLAHDVLVDGWDTLRGWRGHAIERDVIGQRLARAAAEWDRLGRPSDALWTGRRLAEASELSPPALSAIDAAFLVEARRAARRRWLVRRALVLGVPVLVGLGFAGARVIAHARTAAEIAAHVTAADAAIARAGGQARALSAARTHAFAAFDARQRADGEAAWDRVLDQQATLDATYRGASEHLEAALALDGDAPEVRRRFAALLFERAVLAEATHRPIDRDEQMHRMRAYDDDGSARARWAAPAELAITSEPDHAQVTAQPAGAAPIALGTTPIAAARLAPGAYVLAVHVDGRPDVRAPIVVTRGELFTLRVPVPAAVPDAYVFIPPGRFQYGSSDDEDMRRTMMNAQPLHTVSTPGYVIARHEVTFADWMTYLRALPAAERARRLPSTPQTASAHAGAFLALREPAPGQFALTIQPTSQAYTADESQPIRYQARATASAQAWPRMPVSGISWDDAVAYGAWLDANGRLPGARPCDEHEWERAARGADARLFPHGDRLAPDDADLAETYGRQPAAFGPDEVGTHAKSDSPFGVADLAGNAWEWVASVSGDEQVAIRGGSWYHNPLAARANNREPEEPALRAIVIGVRMCASWPPRDH